MIDFSAFPKRKRYYTSKLYVGSILVLIVSLSIGVVLGSIPQKEFQEIGYAIVFLTLFAFSLAGFIILAIIIYVFFKKLFFPRIKHYIIHNELLNPPIDEYSRIYERFAEVNGFDFEQYAPDTLANEDSYKGLIEKYYPKDDVYMLFKITGLYKQTEFFMYVLGYAETTLSGPAERVGMGYMFDHQNRRVDCKTVISVRSEHTLKTKLEKAGVRIAHGDKYSYVHVDGIALDREIVKKMFSKI